MDIKSILIAIDKDSAPGPPTILAVRYSNVVSFYNVSDWSLNYTTPELSCSHEELAPPSGLEISPDNSFFVTSGQAGTGVYSMSNGTELYLLENSVASRPRISNSGDYIAIADGDDIIIVETVTWTIEQTIYNADLGGIDDCLVFAWNSDDTKLVVGDFRGHVVILETNTWTLWSNVVDLLDNVYDINFSPDDTLIAVSLDDYSTDDIVINIMEVATTLVSGSEFTHNFTGQNSYGNCFNSDGSEFIGANEDDSSSSIEIWNTTTWISRASQPNNASLSPSVISISDDNTYLAVGSDNTLNLMIYNVDDFTEVTGIPTPSSEVTGVAWNHP